MAKGDGWLPVVKIFVYHTPPKAISLNEELVHATEIMRLELLA